MFVGKGHLQAVRRPAKRFQRVVPLQHVIEKPPRDGACLWRLALPEDASLPVAAALGIYARQAYVVREQAEGDSRISGVHRVSGHFALQPEYQ